MPYLISSTPAPAPRPEPKVEQEPNFKIEQVPITRPKHGRYADTYPWDHMRPGTSDSFLIKTSNKKAMRSASGCVRASALKRGMQALTRCEGEFNLRVWRTK